MSKWLLNTFLLTLIFAGSYFWYVAEAICPIPLSYHVGELDDEFGITYEEARAAISEAESLWEDATGLNLFTYADDGDMPINFIYDERQEMTDAEHDFSQELDAERLFNQTNEVRYNSLVSQFETANQKYENQATKYGNALADYNAEVEYWNREGGAPQDIYDQVNQKRIELEQEKAVLDRLRNDLNELVEQINALSDDLNDATDDYNEKVYTYNHTFAEATEFTQGDYQRNRINIYQFDSHETLVLVLAHELGHALGIEHVDGDTSIMFMRMDAQSTDLGVSYDDLKGFKLVCGDGSFWSRVTNIRFW